MIGTGYVFTPGHDRPAITRFTRPPDLDYLQSAVGGYIEIVPYWGDFIAEEGAEPVRCLVLCNEEGKVNSMAVNRRATQLWDQALRRVIAEDGKPLYPTGLSVNGGLSDILVGPILVLTGDAAFMAAL